MNISSQAHHTNLNHQKQLEADGYKFKVNEDGWQATLDTVPVALGKVPQGVKGEERVKYALDRAVFETAKHRRNLYPGEALGPETKVFRVEGGTTEVTGLPTGHRKVPANVLIHDEVIDSLSKPASKAHPAIQKAINFLMLAGAQYHIEHDGQVHKNFDLAQPLKEKRQQAAQHYKPLLDKQQTPFSTIIQVPEEFTWHAYVQALRAYAYKAYGQENCVITAKVTARSIEVMVA